VHDKHPKRIPRIHAFLEQQRLSQLDERLWFPRGAYVTYKLKVCEVAKPNKVARMIGDMGIAASLQGAWIAAAIKKGMQRIITSDDAEYEFCSKPEPGKLAQVFRNLMAPRRRVYFVYFSDDSCISIRTQHGVATYNMDIRKCDSSHRRHIFLSLLRLVPDRLKPDMQKLLDQCHLPIRITNPDDKAERVVLEPTDYTLYSGSTLTTIVNNLANLLIARSIAESKADTPRTIKAAAARAGYLIELTGEGADKPCAQPEDIQFLKHSPVRDTTGEWRAMLNLGVLLRASGKCKGDLPRGPDLESRAKAFQYALVQGMYPRTHFALRDALLAAAGSTNERSIRRVSDLLRYKNIDSAGHSFHVHAADLYRRYRLTEREYSQLENEFGHLSYGGAHISEAASRILELDYGLVCR